MNGRIRLTWTAVAAVAFLLSVQGCRRRTAYEEVLRLNAEAVNRKCPIQIDAATRLDSTQAGPGKRFRYCYTMTRQILDSIDVKAMAARLKPVLAGNLKTNESLELLKKHKTRIDYSFFDRKGRFILTVSVSPEDYGR
jgi:hypothetical protein